MIRGSEGDAKEGSLTYDTKYDFLSLSLWVRAEIFLVH
jgi:hypothetical protein